MPEIPAFFTFYMPNMIFTVVLDKHGEDSPFDALARLTGFTIYRIYKAEVRKTSNREPPPRLTRFTTAL